MQAGSSMALTLQVLSLDSCCAKEAMIVKPSCTMADEKNVTTRTGAQESRIEGADELSEHTLISLIETCCLHVNAKFSSFPTMVNSPQN